MTISKKPALLGAYFTLSGNVYPFGPSEISPFAFEDRVKAAANAGYTGFGLGYADLMAVGDDLGYPEMRRILQDNGIEHVEFELLADWYSSGEKRRQSDKQRFEFLEAAEALGARGIKVWADIGEPIDDYSTIVEEYALLCRQAHEHGTKFMFEVTPFDTVRSIEGARKIMEDCGEKNCALLLDIWHISRGHMNIEKIRDIPGHFIHSIELADADIYPLKDLIEDTCHRRRLCGEGSFELARFIDAVKSTGYAGPWGVEILSADFRQKPLDQLATTSYQTAIKMFNL